jgi:hypothetical protein
VVASAADVGRWDRSLKQPASITSIGTRADQPVEPWYAAKTARAR